VTIPLPHATPVSAPHWQGCREGRLLVQRCATCGRYVFIPRPGCTHCLTGTLEWVESSGRGTVYSFSVVHRPQRPEFEVPYVVAVIELEEGWHMLSNLVDVAPEAVGVGLPVEVAFREMSPDVTLPYFRPAIDP